MKNTMNLQNYGVAKMSTREMETTNGGGLLADLVEAVVEQIKCGCQPSVVELDDMSLYLR